MYVYTLLHACNSICTYISLLCQLRGSRSNNIAIAISTPRTQSLVSNTILQLLLEIGFLGEMADFWTRAGSIQNGPGTTPCSSRK